MNRIPLLSPSSKQLIQVLNQIDLDTHFLKVVLNNGHETLKAVKKTSWSTFRIKVLKSLFCGSAYTLERVALTIFYSISKDPRVFAQLREDAKIGNGLTKLMFKLEDFKKSRALNLLNAFFQPAALNHDTISSNARAQKPCYYYEIGILNDKSIEEIKIKAALHGKNSNDLIFKLIRQYQRLQHIYTTNQDKLSKRDEDGGYVLEMTKLFNDKDSDNLLILEWLRKNQPHLFTPDTDTDIQILLHDLDTPHIAREKEIIKAQYTKKLSKFLPAP